MITLFLFIHLVSVPVVTPVVVTLHQDEPVVSLHHSDLDNYFRARQLVERSA